MGVQVGYTCVLDNMLPEGIPGAGRVVLVGLVDPELEGGTNYRAADLAISWTCGQDYVEQDSVVGIGETFQVGDQTWRLDAVDPGKGGNRAGSYHATITRVA